MILGAKNLDLLASAIIFYHLREEGLNGRGGITKNSVASYFHTKPQAITQKTFDVSFYLDGRHLANEVYEFIDKDRFKVNEMYWDFLDSNIVNDSTKSIKKLKEIILKDPNFFDPYIAIHEYYFSKNETKKAFEILTEGFNRAMRLVYKSERFPDELIWGFMENRHIIRIMFTYATLVWLAGDNNKSLAIMLQLLKSNPNDNIGARYYIVAIEEGYACAEDLDEMFEEEFKMNAIKIENWFDKKAKKHKKILGWWLDLEE